MSFAAIFNRLTPIVNLLYKKCLSEGKREVKMIKKTSKSDFSLNKSPNGGVKLIRSGIPGMDDLLKEELEKVLQYWFPEDLELEKQS